jgi:hypothetical protein
MNTKCPICDSFATEEPKTRDGQKLACNRCGDFFISGTASATWANKEPDGRQIANTSGWIREHQGVELTSYDIDSLLTIKTPNVSERALKILLAVESENLNISDTFSLSLDNTDEWLGISYSTNYVELHYLFKTYIIDELGLLSISADTGNSLYDISITPRGHAYLENYYAKQPDSQIGFCAMWFDKSVLPIWTNAIEPAIKNAGYNPKRIDGHQHNNRIDDEIIAMLRRSKFVVADFTGQRGGVYFEAGFALGLGLQVIWTCKKSDLKEVHFDNRQYNFIIWEEDKLDEFNVALQNRIEATIGHGNFS